MKRLLLLALILLVCPYIVRADNLLQNSDFSDGAEHWQGDGKTPQAYAEANPAAATNPLTGKGLIITLNPTAWTRIYQYFLSDKGTQYSIVVKYKVSPNLAFSKNAADYTAINKLFQIPGFEAFGSISGQPRQFYGTVGDPNSSSIAGEVFAPALASNDVQTYEHTYPPIPVSEAKIVGLAFPPGTGTVVILNVSMTSNSRLAR